MTLIEIALASVIIATLIGLGIALTAIRTPASRKEMGIRLQDDDFEDFDWIDLNEEDWNRIKNDFYGSNS